MKPIELLDVCLLSGSIKYLEKGTGNRYLYWFYYPNARRYYYDYKLCILSQLAGKRDFFTRLKHSETSINLNVPPRDFVDVIHNISEVNIPYLVLESLHYSGKDPYLKIVKLKDNEILELKKLLDGMGLYCQIMKFADHCKMVFTRSDVYGKIRLMMNRELPLGTWSILDKKNDNLGIIVNFNDYKFVLDVLTEALPNDYYIYHIFADQFSIIDNFGIDMKYLDDMITEKTSELFVIHNLAKKFFTKKKVCAIGVQTQRIADCCRDFGANIVSFTDSKIKADYFVDFNLKDLAVKQMQDILKEIQL